MTMSRMIRKFQRAAASQLFGPEDFVAPVVGILAIGMLAGAGIALFFAPMTGKKLREEMENKLMGLRSRLLLEEREGIGVADRSTNARVNQVTS
jgi:gas vesicle protein